MFLGVDIGSSTSKAVITDDECRILTSAVINAGTGTKGPERAVQSVLNQLGLDKTSIKYSVATGYGRIAFEEADSQITEISCHGKGAAILLPKARTVLDIGGQDAKVIRINEGGKVENFVMNDKCAAGTGRFLEVMARILDCGISELADLAEGATGECVISNTCTVFAESEVISQLASGTSKENVAKGAHRAIAKRVAGLGHRIGIKTDILMTGGVALNRDVVAALANEIGEKIVVAQNPQIAGALGAALYAREFYLKGLKREEK